MPNTTTPKKAPARKAAAPTPARKAAAKKAEPAVEAPKPRRTLAATEGSQRCRACRRTLPLTMFPTKAAAKDGTVSRDDRCRACRDEARAARKATP